MTALFEIVKAFFDKRFRAMAANWNWFWFTPADPAALAAIRICTGAVLFYVHAACSPALLDLIGPDGWVDAATIDVLQRAAMNPADGGWPTQGWTLSIWHYVQEPVGIWIVHGAFLIAIGCFAAGLFSRTTSVLAWAGHLSFLHRGFYSCFGVDSVLAMLTFYLMFAPTGAAFSLDRLRARRADAQRGRGAASSLDSAGKSAPRWQANLVIRLIQVHLCVIYLCSGLAKLQGSQWWDGTAIWTAIMLQEFALVDMSWLAAWGDLPCIIVSNTGVALTLGLEISFVFLIWNRSLRPVCLGLALLLHTGIGALMGMGSFGAVMLTACLAFVAPGTVRRFIDICRSRSWIGSRVPLRQPPKSASVRAGEARRAA